MTTHMLLSCDSLRILTGRVYFDMHMGRKLVWICRSKHLDVIQEFIGQLLRAVNYLCGTHTLKLNLSFV
jgi:hypothetical protein